MSKLEEKIQEAKLKLANAETKEDSLETETEVIPLEKTETEVSAPEEDTSVQNPAEGFPEEPAQTEFAKDKPYGEPLASNPFATEKSIHLGSRGGNNPLEGLPMYEPPKGSYKNLRLHSVVLAKGKRVVPNDYGYYESPERELKELLEFYAKKGLVQKV